MNNEFSGFDATRRTAEGNDVAHWSAIKPIPAQNSVRLKLELTAKNLMSGDYVLTISGANASETEEFRRLPFRIVN